MIEIERKIRNPQVLIDVSRVPGLDTILEDGDYIRLGPGVTHNQVVGSDAVAPTRPIRSSRACWEVGAPQIRNRGTIAGNLITASPANDTITPLVGDGRRSEAEKRTRRARSAVQHLFSRVYAKRPWNPTRCWLKFMFQKMSPKDRGTFMKLGLRRAQAISVVNAAVVLEFEDMEISNAWITLGAVAPTIITAGDAEQVLVGQYLHDAVIDEACRVGRAGRQPD